MKFYDRIFAENKPRILNYTTPEQAVSIVNTGDRVFVHSCAATPVTLVNALLARAGEINNVEIVAISTYGNIEWNHPGVTDSFYLNSLFVSDNVREWANSARGGYVPVFLSEIPHLFCDEYLPLDVALIQVSPPDAHGYCTLGTSVDVTISAVRNAKKIIAQVNPRMPRVLGDGIIHVSRFHAMTYEAAELFEVDYSVRSGDVTDRIGAHVASLVSP